MKHYIYAYILMATTALCAQTNENNTIEKWSGSRPDGHAPISVMGDHTHNKGGFMFSYRYMSMSMEELKTGNKDTSTSSLLISNGGKYMVTPTTMPMDMHMLGLMYAPSNNITLSIMVNHTAMTMDHLTAMGNTFTTESSGFGDLKFGMLYRFFNGNKNQLHANFKASIPTGVIDNKDVTPASSGNEVILPYPMQIGSGTYDTGIGLTYLKQGDVWSFGSQINGLFRFGKNDNDYRLGNRYNFNNWFAVKANNWLSFSARLEGVIVEEIKGANPTLNPMMTITANTNNSGGTYVNSGLGLNFYVPSGTFKNFRIGFEYATPLLQDINGTQLKTKETITLGLQYAL